MAHPARPKNLNLTTIRLSLPALVSILHRVSGLLLFLAIPLLLLVLQATLHSPQQFAQVVRVLAHPLVKLLLLAGLLALIHHVLAGLRHLAMNMHWWHGLKPARLSGKLVLLLDVALTIWIAVLLW